jgi:hypothetical protein
MGNLIAVPGLDEVLALAGAASLELDERLVHWSGLLAGCSRTYEVSTWEPTTRTHVSEPEVRVRFQKDGFAGRAAAFITWVARGYPKQLVGTVLEPNPQKLDYVPYVGRKGSGKRNIGWEKIEHWVGGYSFVAFKEVPAN